MTLQNYLLDLVNPNIRPTCVGFSNMLVAPMSFLPMLGGIIVATMGYKSLFAITLFMGLTSFCFSLKMQEPRKPSGDYPGRALFLPLRRALPFKNKHP